MGYIFDIKNTSIAIFYFEQKLEIGVIIILAEMVIFTIDEPSGPPVPNPGVRPGKSPSNAPLFMAITGSSLVNLARIAKSLAMMLRNCLFHSPLYIHAPPLLI